MRRSLELATDRLTERSPLETDYAAFRALKGTSGQGLACCGWMVLSHPFSSSF